MAVDLAELGISVRSDGVLVANKRLKEMERQSGKTEKATDRLIRKTEQMGQSMQRVGTRMSLALTAPLAAISAASVKLAIDAEETANKFDVVFRGSIDRSRDALEQLTSTIPLTRSQMEAMAAGIQDMLVPMGVARQEAAGMSVQMIELAGDMASFNNVGTDQVLMAMQSALAGSSEPMRRYGVDTRETRLEQLALKEGIIGVNDELDNTSRAQAVLAAIMADSTDAMGDAARTVDSTANQIRFLRRDLRDISEELGRDLIPAVRKLLPILRQGVEWFGNLNEAQRANVIRIGALVAAIGPLLIILGSVSRGLSAVIRLSSTIRPLLTGMAAGFGAVGFAAAAAAIELERKLTPGMEEVGRGAQIFNVVTRAAIILRETFGALADAAKAMGEIVVSSFQAIVGPATAVITGIADAFMALINRDFEGAKKALKGIGSDMVQEFTDSMSGMAGAFDELGESVTERARTAVDEVTALQNSLTATGESASESTEGMGMFSDSIQILLDRARAYMQAMGEQAGGTDEAREASAEWRRELDELEAQLAGPMAQANMEFAQRIEDINERFADGEGDVKQWARAINLARMALEHARRDALSDADGLGFGMFDAALEGMDAIADKMREMQDLEFDFENLIDSFHPLAQEMRRLGDAIDVVNDSIAAGDISDMEGMLVKSGAAANAMFGAMMSGVNRTSKEYENLQKAQQIVNVALGIAAILQQGMGDPYTAIPRMVAMAAMVASLGVNTGRLSGGGAAQRQQTQGTGTVLGDAEAKSESIVNATEITADATSELVGINRSMLRALEGLRDRIAGASGQIARGAGQLDVSGIDLGRTFFEDVFATFDPLGFAIDSFIGGLFGFGKTKVKDQGIALLGGLIVDLTEGAVAQAFADLKRKSIFGNKSKTVFEDLDDEFNTQLNLIFQSLIDTVTAAGEALGIPLDELEARIATFEVEAQKISLKDLSAEEQQAELEAVFGAIFDRLAGHVVPFIGQFQQVGEGLGETLVRVASSVQVVEEALKRLGFQAERTGVEQFAQLSVALVEAAGGLNEFIEGMSAFMQHFAPEAHQLTVMGESLASAFEQVGLTLPTTREELWALMQTLDANTEAGREQIATLLELADMADAYYSALEDATRDYANAVQGVEEALVLDGLSDFQREMVGIQRELMQTVDAMNSAARAAGLQGAREEDLARAHELAAIRAQQAIARLESQAEEWVGELFGTSLSAITAQVNEAQAAFENLQSQLRQLSDFADSLLIGQFSPLPSGQRLAEAMAQLEAASAAGDVSGVQSIAQTVLQIARDRFASGQQFTDIFNEVQDIIRGTDPADSVQGVSIISAPGLAPLLRQQSQLEQEAEDRREQMLANDIAQAVADLAMATGDSFEDVATRLGFDLQDLGDVLGLNEQELANFIESLQVDTGDIATHLETLGDRIVAAILEGRDIQNAIDDRSVDSRTGGLAGDPIDERDIDSRFGGMAGERDVESITDSQGETTRAVEDASRDIRESMETPAERAERMALLRRIAEAQEARSGGRNVRTRSAA